MTLVPLPPAVASDILFAAQRTCCVCRVLGKPVQLHHIDEDPSNNALDNLAVLCLECHHQTQIQGGLARHLSQSEVTKHRDDWRSQIQRRRNQAKALAVEVSSNRSSLQAEDYIRTLPALRKRAYANARMDPDSGSLPSVAGSFTIIDVMQEVLVTLGGYYPAGHFGGGSVRDYMSELLATHLRWHYNRHQPNRRGQDNGSVNAFVAEAAVADSERMVVELAESSTPDAAVQRDFEFANWKQEWDASQYLQPSIDVDVSSGKRAVVRVTNRGEAFTLSMRGQLVKSNSEIEHSYPFEFLPRRASEDNPIVDYTIATVDAYGVVAVYGEHLDVIQTWQCAAKRKLRFRLALTFLSNELRRTQPVAKCLVEIECDPKTAKLKAKVV